DGPPHAAPPVRSASSPASMPPARRSTSPMHEFAADHTAALELTAALILGAVIGLERGWRERERAEGSRVAGLRTFSLVGLLGGALGMLNEATGPWPVAAGLLGLGLLAIASYRENVR